MFAVVRIQGKQYIVSPDDILLVDHLDGEAGKSIQLSDVLLLSNEKDVHVGTPVIPRAIVKAKILGQQKGEKLDVFRFRAKSRHRRHIGFRAQRTQLQILSVSEKE